MSKSGIPVINTIGESVASIKEGKGIGNAIGTAAAGLNPIALSVQGAGAVDNLTGNVVSKNVPIVGKDVGAFADYNKSPTLENALPAGIGAAKFGVAALGAQGALGIGSGAAGAGLGYVGSGKVFEGNLSALGNLVPGLSDFSGFLPDLSSGPGSPAPSPINPVQPKPLFSMPNLISDEPSNFTGILILSGIGLLTYFLIRRLKK